ncbi:MAG TPA: hypothetical protein V6C86_12470 [Oculatellaceae cyanobacterium]
MRLQDRGLEQSATRVVLGTGAALLGRCSSLDWLWIWLGYAGGAHYSHLQMILGSGGINPGV